MGTVFIFATFTRKGLILNQLRVGRAPELFAFAEQNYSAENTLVPAAELRERPLRSFHRRKSLDNPWADVAGENGTPTDGATTETDTEPAGGQFKMTDASINNAAGASADCKGGENVDNAGCNTAASNAGKGGGDGKTYIPARK